MGNKMLIDAAHPEETRVVVLRGNRIEEFDFEAANKKQLRGNIYLAKVTRVEPSLQAAFIEYGGNRHGFLAFSEIHPDYYQIPVADRQALLDDEARSADEDEEEPRSRGNGGGGNGGGGNGGGGNGGEGHRRSRRHRRGGQGGAEKRSRNTDETVASEETVAGDDATGHEDGTPVLEIGADDGFAPRDEAAGTETEAGPDAAHFDTAPAAFESEAPSADAEPVADMADDARADTYDAGGEQSDAPVSETHESGAEDGAGEAGSDIADLGGEADHVSEAGEHAHEDEGVEQLGGDALEDVPHRVSRPRRHYKIQEVIKRRQVLLVQVVKEERGNKGAALTTYLSLAGRYSVLMPNTARGGGISRKIVDPEDRKRLKAIAQELEVPDGMGIILRTAGASRGMPEVKRDFEYLMRMWETVRETTLSSTAPTLVYEEGSLIKRSIRDLFTKDVDEVVVSGEEGYREAKEFMRLLMPNQVRNVVHYRDPQPVFAKSGVEAQLDAMFSNQVVLKSGGYIVINQTEALVAIDVNSGRSTREHNIEDTALRTNLEAADEVARQLRLRDLAGLIVVDFIDMEEGRNDRAVERRLKDALKNDRARIQIGRISHFGLLEMSRQRMRTGVLEGSTVMCPHCAGSGMVRSVASQALHVLRLLEDALIRSAAYNLIARTRSEVALYILNQKRANMLDLESRFGVQLTVLADPTMTGMVYHAIERGAEATPPQFLPFRADTAADVQEDLLADEGVDEEEQEETVGEADGASAQATANGQPQPREASGEEGGRRRRRRRRRRGRDGAELAPRTGEQGADGNAGDSDALGGTDEPGSDEEEQAALTDIEGGFLPEGSEPEPVEAATEVPPAAAPEPVVSEEAAAPSEPVEAEATEAPRRRRSSRRSPRATEAAAADAAPVEAAPEAASEETPAPARRSRRSRSRVTEPAAEPVVAESSDQEAVPVEGASTGVAETAKAAPPAEEPASQAELPLAAEPEPASAAAEPEPTAEPDPDRPKRSGWWQRAKATFASGT